MLRLFTFLVFLSFSFPLFSQWQQTGGPEGGTVYALEEVNGSLWAGTAGGVYTSDDHGASWALSNIVPVEHPVLDIEQNGNEVIMLTAHINLDLNAWEYEAYISSNDGASWMVFPVPGVSYSLISGVFTHKGNAFYVSYDARVYRSVNGGAIWELMYALGGNIISQIAFDDDHLLVSNYNALFLSSDQGDSWSFVDSIDTNSPLFLEDSTIILQNVYDSFYVSQDLGATWTVMPPIANSYDITFKRGASGKVYGYDYSTIIVSEDNGMTWQQLGWPAINAQSFDLIENGDHLLFATGRGIFKTNDQSQTWAPSSNGIIANTVYYLFASPSGELFAYTSSGKFRSSNGGLTWFNFELDYGNDIIYDMEFSGDTMYLATANNVYLSTGGDFAPMFPANTYSAGHSITRHDGKLYVTAYDKILYTDNLGATWDYMNLPNTFSGDWDDIAFVNDHIAIFNNQGVVFWSMDNGANWSQELAVSIQGAGNRNRFYHIGDRLFIPDFNGIWVSTDGGFTWTSQVPTGVPVIVEQWGDETPIMPSSLVGINNLMFGTFRFNGVYVSSDNGQSWSPANDGLGNLRTRSSALGNGVLYVGTSTGGVWRRGGSFKSLSGLVYNDLNNNGTHDDTEPPLQGTVVKTAPLNSYTNTQLDGTFFLYGEAFNDTLRAIPPSQYATVAPPYYIVQGDAAGNDFGIHFIPNMDDLCITATSLEPFRPGFDNTVFLTVKNVGTTAQAPKVTLQLPAPVSYLSASPTPTTVDGGTLTWELPEMQPFESQNLLVSVVLDATTPIGDFLSIVAKVEPNANDQDPYNNHYLLREEVIGSFDPNDKKVEPADMFPLSQLAAGQPLIYTVRFQNTGNYFAENVRILDTLSTQLDLSTLKVLSSSHPCEWFVRNGTLLEFVFENIFLPDSLSDEPGSHGFVKFSVQPKPHLVLGDQVDNLADIYFDFNAPIRTNTAGIVITNFVEVKERDKAPALPMAISPNPNNGSFRVTLPSFPTAAGELKVFNAQGKLVHAVAWPVGQQAAWVQLPTVAAGAYFLQLTAAQQEWNGRVVVGK